MSSTGITFDDGGLIAAFRELSLDAMRQVGYEAFSAALPIIRKGAEREFEATGLPIDRVGKSGRTMRQGITALAYRDGSGGSVTALGEYKAKWFAAGTQERWQDIKHGKKQEGAHRYLGSIKATHFLEKGYDAVVNEYTDTLENTIIDSIDRILTK